jgi:KUP system potassium uptake protein
VPLAISVVFVITAITWLGGRRCITKTLLERQIPLERFKREARPSQGDPKGTMIFLTGDQHGVPFVGGKASWVRARADEELVVLLTLVRAARPYETESERVSIEHVSDRLVLVRASFGYMEPPRIDPILAVCGAKGLRLDSDEADACLAAPLF